LDPTEILRVEGLRKWFAVEAGLLDTLRATKSKFVRAVDGVDFKVVKGEVFTLAGESGSGKTTLARIIVRLASPTAGNVFFNDVDIFRSKTQNKTLRGKIQMIFQDPYGSFDPHSTLYKSIAEPLQSAIQHYDGKTVSRLVEEALESVGLTPGRDFFDRQPQSLSGGQLQRASIARAIVAKPDLIVADEPTSMLDVSVRSKIVNLLLELGRKLDLTILMITHDIAMARHVSDRIAVMYLGKIVEIASAQEIVKNPLHPYTKALLAAIPTLEGGGEKPAINISTEIPSAINIPKGCRFNTRCPYAFDRCFGEEPTLEKIDEGHFVSCYLVTKS
jgi:peptide/nickel transport system ATP-binding protein